MKLVSFMSTSQLIVKSVFQRIIGREVLHNIRPNFMKNPITRRNLELDIYDPVEKIAIEYNGIQHYFYVEKFHKSYNDFVDQQERDVIKKRLCMNNNIHLIVVPYYIFKYDRNIDIKQKKENIVQLETFLRDMLP